MPIFQDPYSTENLTAARAVIADKHKLTLAIGDECYQQLGTLLAEAQWTETPAAHAIHALAARVFDLLSSTLNLLKTGTVPAAKIITRSLLEAAYKLRALKKNEDHLGQFIADDIATRLLLLKGFHKYKQQKRSKTTAVGIEKQIDALTLEGAMRIDAPEWASRAEMDDFHRLFYPWLSREVHTNLAALSEYYLQYSDFAIEVGPSDADLPMTLVIAVRGAMAVIGVLTPPSSTEWASQLRDLDQRLGAIEAQ